MNKDKNIKIKKYNPLNDLIFKRYMSIGNGKIAKYIINAIFRELAIKEIDEIEILVNELFEIIIESQKVMKTDFKAQDNKNRRIIVEMQQQREKCFKIRTQGYLDRFFLENLDKVKKYYKVQQHILIGIVNFKFCKDKDYVNYNNKFNIVESKNIKCNYSKIKKIIIIDLVNFKKLIRTNKIDLNNELHQILIFLNKEQFPKLFNEVKKMNTTIKEINEDILNYLKDPEEYNKYKNLEDKARSMQYELRYQKEKGIKEGKKEGKIEDAINMKKENLSLESINKITGLSIEEIKKL
jgi:predicted transposase/invertase (TIGR01784 family)